MLGPCVPRAEGFSGAFSAFTRVFQCLHLCCAAGVSLPFRVLSIPGMPDQELSMAVYPWIPSGLAPVCPGAVWGLEQEEQLPGR